MAEHENRNRLLHDPEKRVVEARGLSKIFRNILSDLNITPMKWDQLMNAYLNNPKNRVGRDSRSRSSTRGNLNKELVKKDMTWRNFERAIRFLNPVEAEFTVKLRWRNGRTTLHGVKMVNDPRAAKELSDSKEENDDDDND